MMDAATCHRLLRDLRPGDRVPAPVHVADYRDRSRPPWTVAEREPLGAEGVRLTLVDVATGDMFDRVAVVVLTFPRKTVRTRPQPHGLTGPAIVGGKLCDMLQQGRHAAKRSPGCDDGEDDE
jgi:hypothetical protein